jgi:predicted enzyme related to lactoylglutathione lyase
MAIVNALAGIMVSDLTTAEAWYEQLLSRPADARPMEGLAEWALADGGWIQVFQDKERAGSSSVTFLVSGLDDQLAELKAKGISIERTTTSDYVKTATVTDPAGNRVVFAELAAQHYPARFRACRSTGMDASHHCRSQSYRRRKQQDRVLRGSATEVRVADERPPERRKDH